MYTDHPAFETPHFALTPEQHEQLDADLNLISAQAKEIATLLQASFGGSSDVAIRAGDVDAALQRLQWSLDRARADEPRLNSSIGSEFLSARDVRTAATTGN